MPTRDPKPMALRIDQLRFDPENPRIPSSIDGSNEGTVIEWMLRDAGIPELMMSIAEQGYFSGEPMLVCEDSIGSYIVVEGNRRLAALKLLQNPELAPERQTTLRKIVSEAKEIPSSVPVIVYKDRSSILDYLGFRHVTGIKQWSPLSKARYLNDLGRKYDDLPEDDKYRLLAKTIGSRVDYVKRMLAGLKLYDKIEANDFYRIDGLDEQTLSFSLITTALANSEIVNFLGLSTAQDLEQENLNEGHLLELTTWLFKKGDDNRPPIGESRNIKQLNKVVASEMALAEFRRGRRLEEALVFTDEPIESLRELASSAKTSLLDAQKQLYLIRHGFSPDDLILIEDLQFLIDDIHGALKQRLNRQSSRNNDTTQ